MDPMEEIKQTFFQECEELLVAMEEGLLAMEGGEADNEVINAVFRAVHSIKGGAGAFSYDSLVGFAHKFETVLDHIRSGKLDPEPEVVSVLLRAGDILADHVAAVRNGETLAPGFDDAVKAELAALSGDETQKKESPGARETAIAETDEFGFTPMRLDIADDTAVSARREWHIHFAPYPGLLAKANEPYLLIRELAEFGDAKVTADISHLPALPSLDPEQTYLSWDIVLHTDVERARIEEIFEFVIGDCDLRISEKTEKTPSVEELPDATREDVSVPEETAAKVPPPAAEKKEATPSRAPGETAVKQSIRVDLEKMDRLVNIVSEMVITQAMLSQRVAECGLPRASLVHTGLTELEHILRELQDSVMAIRTQPVKSVFQRMPRLVRELAAQTNKKVQLVVEGEGTEVDNTVIERLGEPLVHMIRNAVDHGLETPEERIAAGKQAAGTITLSAQHRGGRIVIEVSDDGRGIDRDRVLTKAMEKKLVSKSANLSDEEIDNLIFMPGFSTASKVSNISGRGVGMDVVRRNIVDLGGRIVISNNPRRGSRFSLTLPLTLAVLDGMVVAVGDQTFVVPLSHIVESLQPKTEDIRPFGLDKSLLNIRNAYVPLIPVGELLGVTTKFCDPAEGVVILVESEGAGRLALCVDRILGQRQVVIKGFQNNYGHIDGIAAATILGDGRVALILDVDGLVTHCRNSRIKTPELQTAVGV